MGNVCHISNGVLSVISGPQIIIIMKHYQLIIIIPLYDGALFVKIATLFGNLGLKNCSVVKDENILCCETLYYILYSYNNLQLTNLLNLELIVNNNHV